MEESKAAAYYDELTRKGEGAARFKQGLGFSSSSSSTTSSSRPPPSSVSSSSSFLSSFVRAGERPSNSDDTERPPEKERERDISESDRRQQLDSIKNKLSRKPSKESKDRGGSREERGRERDRDRARDSDRDRDRDRDRSSRDRGRDRDRDRERHHRDRDRERDRYDRERDRSRDRRSRDRYGRSRSPSRREQGRSREKENSKSKKVDYAQLIPGYDRMTAAEQVKEKMKLQLSETAAKDPTKGMGKGWERFDFDKDAPLDNEDEDLEAADDDALLMKNIGKSFRFSAVEANREDEIRRAHDEAIFGGSTTSVAQIGLTESSINREESNDIVNEKDQGGILKDTSSLVNDKIFAMQQGSWRDRIQKSRDEAK